MKLLWLLPLLALACSSCRRSIVSISSPPPPANTLHSGMFIDAPGNWSHTRGNATTTLDSALSGNLVSVTISRTERHGAHGHSGSSSSRDIDLTDPADPWFIHVETPERLWYFNGRDNLDYTMTGGGGSQSGTILLRGRKAPDGPVPPGELILRLPEELRKLFPPVESPSAQPSF